MEVSVPGQAKKTLEKLAPAGGWRSLRWLGFSSLADGEAVFYLDNLVWKVEMGRDR